MARRYGVAVADATVGAMDDDFAASIVLHDLAGTIDSVALAVGMVAAPGSTGLDDVPAAGTIRHNMSFVSGHRLIVRRGFGQFEQATGVIGRNRDVGVLRSVRVVGTARYGRRIFAVRQREGPDR